MIDEDTQRILDTLPTPQESWQTIEAYRKQHGGRLPLSNCPVELTPKERIRDAAVEVIMNKPTDDEPGVDETNFTDTDRIDWMEKYPEAAVAILNGHGYSPDLRKRIDRLIRI